MGLKYGIKFKNFLTKLNDITFLSNICKILAMPKKFKTGFFFAKTEVFMVSL